MSSAYPVTSLQEVFQCISHLQQTIVQQKLKTNNLNLTEWLNTIKVIDKLNWAMRMKTSSKIYTMLQTIKTYKWDLGSWRVAYRLFHAIADWWTNGHPSDLFSYNKDLIDGFVAHFNNESTKTLQVVLTMTSCKRFDLLSRTINSMLVNITDLKQFVREWIIVDDNSSQSDRDMMKRLYPFITFVFKTPEQKGHPQSMNMIRDMLLSSNAPYNLHIEDDWEFWYPDAFIGKCIHVLNEDKQYGQTLFNFEYTEDERTAQQIWNRDMNYLKFEGASLRYFVHEFFEGERLKIEQNHLGGGSSMYWPHFSFRPGITRNEVYKRLGAYHLTHQHFEMEYAQRYVQAGYKTAMLDCCYSTHTGRRTYERDSSKLNAYDLNQEQQFGSAPKTASQRSKEPEIPVTQQRPNQPPNHMTQMKLNELTQIRSNVINLERRPERILGFIRRNNDQVFSYTIFNAVDGKKLTPNSKIQRIFETGDYNFRRGIVGCAYSHLKIWSEFLKGNCEFCIVLEDDVTLSKMFNLKLMHLLTEYKNAFDCLMLHWNPYPHTPNHEDWECNYKAVSAELWDVERSCKQNMGSGAGYVLTRQGALQLLQFVNTFGMPNAVDWVIMKQQNMRIMYSNPKLVFVDCWQNNQQVQSDIQLEYDAVKFKDDNDWLQKDIKVWSKQASVKQVDEMPTSYSVLRKNIWVVPYSKENLEKISEDWLCKWYLVGTSYIIIVPDAFLTIDMYKQFVWKQNRLNMIDV